MSVPPGVVPTDRVYPVGIPVAACQLKFALMSTPVSPLVGDSRFEQEGGSTTT